VIAVKPQNKPHVSGNGASRNGASGNGANGNGASGNGANRALPLTPSPLNPWSPEADALAAAIAQAIADNLSRNNSSLRAIADDTADLYLYLTPELITPACCLQVLMTHDRQFIVKLKPLIVTDHRGISQTLNNGSHTFVYHGFSEPQAAQTIKDALPTLIRRWAETKATERAILTDTLTVARAKADLLAAHPNAQQAQYDATYLHAHLPYTWSLAVSPDGLTIMINYDLCGDDDRQHVAEIAELLRLHESHRCARRHPPRSTTCPPTAPS